MKFENTHNGLVLIPDDNMDHNLVSYLKGRPGGMLGVVLYDGTDCSCFDEITIEMRLRPPIKSDTEFINGVEVCC
jgi:hypothetical protein